MPVTYKLISTITVSTATTANIEFTSIPGIYDDLVVLSSTRIDNTGVGVNLKFNGSGASVSTRGLYGQGSSAASYSNTSNPLGGTSSISTNTASTFSNNMLYIPNYAGNTNKSSSMDGVTENNGTVAYQFLVANLWSNTAAITSITLTPEDAGQNFVTHSSASLYGIKRT